MRDGLGKKWNPVVLSCNTPRQPRNKTCPTVKYLTHGTPPFLRDVIEKIGTGTITINTQLSGAHSDDRQARLPEPDPQVCVARLWGCPAGLWKDVNDN